MASNTASLANLPARTALMIPFAYLVPQVSSTTISSAYLLALIITTLIVPRELVNPVSVLAKSVSTKTNAFHVLRAFGMEVIALMSVFLGNTGIQRTIFALLAVKIV